VVYAPIDVDSNPQLGDAGVHSAAGTAATGVFTVDLGALIPNTTYAYAAYATNVIGTSYSSVDYFTTMATPQSWQSTWYGGPGDPSAAYCADPYSTGVCNLQVFAFLGPAQDPRTASVNQLPQPSVSEGSLYYDFYEPAGITGVTYSAEATADVASGIWQPVADTGSGTEHIFRVPITGKPRLFMRLGVTAK
jgi:trimeric autotransporter adhesin